MLISRGTFGATLRRPVFTAIATTEGNLPGAVHACQRQECDQVLGLPVSHIKGPLARRLTVSATKLKAMDAQETDQADLCLFLPLQSLESLDSQRYMDGRILGLSASDTTTRS